MTPPLVLCILDGWGCSHGGPHDAIALAHTPHLDRLMATCPHARLATSGLAVGLPEGQMGNSEVGHMTIGSGRVVMQELPKIDCAIADGSLERLLAPHLAQIPAGNTLHLLGLLSPGGVHAHQDHLLAVARIAAAHGVRVAIHGWTDGRDTPPQSALSYVTAFDRAIAALPGVRLATLSGRYYAMDRDNRWDRVEKACRAMVLAEGPRAASAEAAIADAYAANLTDEFIPPVVLGEYVGIAPGDGLMIANFRADRVRQIGQALCDPAFDAFPRTPLQWSCALSMTDYSEAHRAWFTPLFPPESLTGLLGEAIAGAGLRQLRIAETEKYAHVTFFFNGGREAVFPGEERIMVPSPRIATYDLQPEMSAESVTDRLIEVLERKATDVVIVNYANADMVGHTGDLAAAIQAIEAVDRCIGRLCAAVDAAGGVLLITADHGNAETMWDEAERCPHTAHTTGPVPLIAAGKLPAGCRLHDGGLSDIAPTMLHLLGIPVPEEMTGRVLWEV
jgi:2,3-bisphosphoglycerate-independent phosphoglycerate mutase